MMKTNEFLRRGAVQLLCLVAALVALAPAAYADSGSEIISGTVCDWWSKGDPALEKHIEGKWIGGVTDKDAYKNELTMDFSTGKASIPGLKPVHFNWSFYDESGKPMYTLEADGSWFANREFFVVYYYRPSVKFTYHSAEIDEETKKELEDTEFNPQVYKIVNLSSDKFTIYEPLDGLTIELRRAK